METINEAEFKSRCASISDQFELVKNYIQHELERNVFLLSDEQIKILKVKYSYLEELNQLFKNYKVN